MKVKIIRLSKRDAWWGWRKKIVGLIGNLDAIDMGGGWMGGKFISDTIVEDLVEGNILWFAFIKFEQVEDETAQ